MVDDQQTIGRNDGDHRRGRHAPHAAAADSNLQQRRLVRIVIRQDPLDRAPAATRD
jgi:hypothetical protein